MLMLATKNGDIILQSTFINFILYYEIPARLRMYIVPTIMDSY